MQCILTRVDFGKWSDIRPTSVFTCGGGGNVFFLADLYYGGEAFSVEQPQSFTCPYCGKMGYTETSLQEHVTSEHAETSTEVVSMHCVCSEMHLNVKLMLLKCQSTFYII